MHYRIKLYLAFDRLGHIDALKRAAEIALTHCIPLSTDPAIEGPGFIQVERCYHDEDPTKPCDSLFYQERSN